MKPIHVIGGGLAGSEAAWQIARRGLPVVLHEMRPVRGTEAHKTDGLAELVCSNSFRSDDRETNAVGLLHEELRRAGSLIMRTGDRHQVPAGGALAVDREGFSAAIGEALGARPAGHHRARRGRRPAAGRLGQRHRRHRAAHLPGPGRGDPRASPARTQLAFFDAIAPIVHFDTIDMDIAWFQSRYDKPGPGGTGADYINCPMDKAEYDAFVDALLAGEQHKHHDWEKVPYFDGCLPIEVMAERGRETLRHGPMKPVGLTNRAQAGREALCRRPAPPGQRARHALQHRRLPDEAPLRRPGRHLPDDPGSAERAVRAPRRPAPQHLPQFAEAPRPDAAAEGDAAAALRRADHRLRGLCRSRPRSGSLPAASPPPSGSARQPVLPPLTTAFGALLGHITGGHLSARRAGQALVPADERQFRPVPADRGRAHPGPAHLEPRSEASPGSGRSRRGRSPTSSVAGTVDR